MSSGSKIETPEPIWFPIYDKLIGRPPPEQNDDGDYAWRVKHRMADRVIGIPMDDEAICQKVADMLNRQVPCASTSHQAVTEKVVAVFGSVENCRQLITKLIAEPMPEQPITPPCG